MRMFVVSVFDRAVAAYGRPIFVRALGEAIRSFQDEANNKESAISKSPDDYDLFELGAFDDVSGELFPIAEPRQIAIGKQMIRS